ncbi:MAG TPA: hypothetical protein VMT67_15215 [Terriglobales bacterium]|nr:hypothetical protein [Terriglobales bacterium]
MSTFVTEQIPADTRFGRAITTLLGHRRNRRVVASAGFGIFQRLVQVASTLIVMPLLLRALGAAQFGVWGAAASLAWLSGLVDIGTGTALVTLVARSSATNRADLARRHIAGALSIGSGLATLMFLVALLASLGGSAPHGINPYLIAAIGLAINMPLSAANNVWMALQKGYVASFWELVQTLLTTGGLIAATAFAPNPRVCVAIVYLGLVVSNLGSLIHLFWLHPELHPGRLWLSWAAIKEVAGQGLLYFLVTLTGALSFLLDNVLALWILGPEASARMTIALRICMTAVGALVVLSQPLWPAFTEAAEKADRRWILKALLRGATLLVGLTVAGSSLLLLFGERLLQWWLGANLGIGSALLWAISAWIVVQALARIPFLLLNGLAVLRYQIVVFSIATGLAFVLKFALAPYLGVAGVLWGTTITVVLIVIPASLWRIGQWAKA